MLSTGLNICVLDVCLNLYKLKMYLNHICINDFLYNLKTCDNKVLCTRQIIGMIMEIFELLKETYFETTL